MPTEMINDIRVTIIQTSLKWEAPTENYKHLDWHLRQIQEQTNLIVLPEMFTTGFSMNPKMLAEKMGGTSMKWMKEKAQHFNAVVVGSLIIEENKKFHNRLIWMEPSGEFQFYDKRHLFRMANEHEHYTAGNQKLITYLKGWRVRPLTCYDLRFPVWSRNQGDYDILIYIANWPRTRSSHWKTLLRARAIENQAFVIGVNRVGEDGNGIHYTGDSAVIDPLGRVISQIHPGEENYDTLELTWRDLDEWREKLNTSLDADEFVIK